MCARHILWLTLFYSVVLFLLLREKWLFFRLWESLCGFRAFPWLVRRQMDWLLSEDQCASAAAHKPPVKGSYMSALNPRIVYGATGASGRRRWRLQPPPALPDKHHLHVTAADSGEDPRVEGGDLEGCFTSRCRKVDWKWMENQT